MSRVWAIVLVAACTWAQDAPSPKHVRKVIDVKHLSGDRAERAVKLVNIYMHPSGSMNFDPVLRTAVIQGASDVVAGGEALFAKFDAPGGVRPDAQVQFRLHLIEASPDGGVSGIPQEVASAVEQMRKTFAYKGYRLLDTLLLQGRGSGEVGFQGTVAGPPDSHRVGYYGSYKQADVLEDGRTVVVRGFRLNLRVPVPTLMDPKQFSISETGISTDFTIAEGQKLVIGKLSATSAPNSIFLIVTADVM
jgi:hypothetical protein